MEYEFRYFVRDCGQPVTERLRLETDGEARSRAAGELLQMPGRAGVEVWRSDCLIYVRRRGGFAAPPPP